MVRILSLFVILLHFGNTHAQYQPVSQDTDDLYYTFMNYQTAVLSGDADWSAKYIDSSSIAHYKKVLDVLQSSDSTTLIQCDITTIFTVVFVRFMAPDGAILSMKNEKDLLRFMIKNSLIKELTNQEVRDIHVNGDSAVVYTSINLNEPVIPFYFVKKDNDWKVEYLTQIDAANNSFEAILTTPAIKERFDGDKSKIVNEVIKEKGWDKRNRNLWKPYP